MEIRFSNVNDAKLQAANTQFAKDLASIIKNKASAIEFMDHNFEKGTKIAFFPEHGDRTYIPDVGIQATITANHTPKFKKVGKFDSGTDETTLTICLAGPELSRYPFSSGKIRKPSLTNYRAFLYAVMSHKNYHELYLLGVDNDKTCTVLGTESRGVYRKYMYGYAGAIFGTNRVTPFKQITDEDRARFKKEREEKDKAYDKAMAHTRRLKKMKPIKSLFDSQEGADIASKALKNATDAELKEFFDDLKKVKKYKTPNPVGALSQAIHSNKKLQAMWEDLDAEELQDILSPNMLHQQEDKGNVGDMLASLEVLDDSSGYEKGYIAHLALYNAYDDLKPFRGPMKFHARSLVNPKVLKMAKGYGMLTDKDVKMLTKA